MAVILGGATTDHEYDHGGFPEHETRARLLAFFPASSFDHSSLFNSRMTGDARMKIEANGRGGDIDEALGIV